jgi:hypothetical protein
MLRSGFWFGSGLRQRTADSFSKRWTLKGALLAGARRALARQQTDTRPNANAAQGMRVAMTGTSLQRIIATQGSAVKATSRPTLFLLASNQPSRTSPLSSAGDRPLNLVRLSSFR